MHQLSVWEKETFFQEQDIVIIGAGLLGLWTAFEIKKRNPNYRITILEKEAVPKGASTRNAGFACFGSPSELLDDIDRMGLDSALTIVEKRCKGIQKIRSCFTDSTIDLDECGGYEGFNHAFEPDKIQWLNKILHPITQCTDTYQQIKDQSTVGVKNFASLVSSSAEAALHSGKYLQALTQKVRAAGIQILFGNALISSEKTSTGIKLHTSYCDFTAMQIIYCTNGFSKQLMGADISPARGQMLLTAPIPQLSLKGTFHFDEGYYYWRNLQDRILIGGARNEDFIGEVTTVMATTDKILAALTAFLDNHIILHQPFTIEQTWSGIMGFTPNKQPIIEQIQPGIWLACCCNGMGVALSPIFAEEIADKVL